MIYRLPQRATCRLPIILYILKKIRVNDRSSAFLEKKKITNLGAQA
jgi:hypothetical protein